MINAFILEFKNKTKLRNLIIRKKTKDRKDLMKYKINQVFKKAMKLKNCFLGKTNKIDQLWVLLERETHTQRGRGREKHATL